MQPIKLSPEQQSILDSPARLKVVKAGPGAGKTRLFVAALQRYREQLPRLGCGVAALSFTNVAQKEIADRLGGWRPPNFVGTIDSFLLRFVVHPFGHIVGLKKAGGRLIPAALYSHFDNDVQVGQQNTLRAKLHDVQFVGVDSQSKPLLRARTAYNSTDVHPSAYSGVLSAKRKAWRILGHFSHSDSHFLANEILRHPEHGAAVVELVLRRFPFLLVDELQDTQFFLGEALVALFGSSSAKGMAVGDPDQAIYEFGGAHPTLFDRLANVPGAETLTLDKTHRCSKTVCKVASQLSCRGATIQGESDLVDGRCLLFILQDAHNEVPISVASAVTGLCQEGDEIAILTRKTETAKALGGLRRAAEFPGKSKIPRRFHTAVLKLLGGDGATARRIVETDLAEMVFDVRVVTKEILLTAKISPHDWRRAVGSTLLEAAAQISGETWAGWQTRTKAHLSKVFTALRCPTKIDILGQKFQNSPVSALAEVRDLHFQSTSAIQLPAGAVIKNIHEVKGTEYDLVAVYVPNSSKPSDCISGQWWIANSEERRIAFVAASRSKRTLALIVHTATFNRLSSTRSDFLSCFEIVPIV
jgi:DNA helicase-2/ATP-dependent DNA helicase PcrA